MAKLKPMTGELMDLLVILLHRPNKACCIGGLAERSVKSALERGWVIKKHNGEWEEVHLLAVGERAFLTYQHFLTTDQKELLTEAFQKQRITVQAGGMMRPAESLVARGLLKPTTAREGGTHEITGQGRELLGLKPE